MIEIVMITYNRRESLRRTLNAIRSSDLSNLKITVLDNCSTDGTSEMLSDLEREGIFRFKHIRHEINIGALANTMRAYELATEEYVWIICDDDDYNFSAFPEVLTVLKNQRPDVVVVGSPINASAEKLFSNRTGKILHAHELSDTELPRLLTFLPSAIIKTEKLKGCDFSVGYELAHTFMPQFFWISQLINLDWSVYVLTNLMVIRPPIEHGLDSDFTHLNGYLNVIRYLKRAEDVEHARVLYFGRGCFTYAIFIAKLMMREKIMKRLNTKDYLHHLVLLNLSRRLLCLAMGFIFLVPTPVLLALKVTKKRLSSPGIMQGFSTCPMQLDNGDKTFSDNR
jgi:glycosyltransferase involved in cell wall biosynthesis